MLKSVQKKDGRIVSFNQANIATAIAKAGAATKEFSSKEATKLAGKVTDKLSQEYDGTIPTDFLIFLLLPCPKFTADPIGTFPSLPADATAPQKTTRTEYNRPMPSPPTAAGATTPSSPNSTSPIGTEYKTGHEPVQYNAPN